MSFEYCGSESYLSDGVYADWWNWETDAEYEARKQKSKEETYLIEQMKLQWLQFVDKKEYSAHGLLNSMFKNTLEKGAILATRRYCRTESINLKYAEAVYKNSKPADLVLSKLKVFDLFMSVDEIKRLDLIFDELERYREDLTVYFKVYEIQLFIHREMQLKNGVRSHLKMDKQIMREVLSCVRLYFLFRELKKMDLDDFSEFLSRYKRTISDARAFIPRYCLESSAEHNENWSLRYQHTLLHYLPKDMRDFIKKIVDLRFEESKVTIFKEVKDLITNHHLQI